MQSSSVSAVSPSFTAYSSNYLADVAARVVAEFRHENGDDYDDFLSLDDYDYNNSDVNTRPEKLNVENVDCDPVDVDEEFEFAVVCTDVKYPLFDRSLLQDVEPNFITAVTGASETDCEPSLVARLPLRKLFSEERDFASSSSSEADDLDGVAPETYCVWKPKSDSPEKCKKSNSTGNSSKRWKFRDILYRSNSDGKQTPFLFFKPTIEKTAKVTATVGDRTSETAEKRGSRRRLYLPSG